MTHHSVGIRSPLHRGRAPGRAAAVTAAASVLCSLGSLAEAQNWSVHATGSASTAVTDNAGNVSDEEGPETAVFNTVAPALLFTFESPRTIHVTTLSLGYTQYLFSDAVPETFNGNLGHGSRFTISRYTELGLGVTAGLGQVSSTLGQVDAGVAEAAPTGDTRFRTIGANQSFNWDFARDWRFNQGVAVTHTETDNEVDDTTTNKSRGRNASLSLSLSRSWARTGVGISTSVGIIDILQDNTGFANFACLEANGVMADCTENLQLVTNAGVNVRRDFNPRWSGNAQVGVAMLTTLETDQVNADDTPVDGTTATPSGSLALNYFRPVGTVTVNLGATVGHSIAPNLLLGTVTRTGGGGFRGSAPLPWFRRGNELTVNASGSIGRAYSWVLSNGDIEEPAWHVDTVDLAIGWSPRQAWTVGLRYQFLAQSIDDEGSTDPMNPAQNPVPVDFSRHTLLFEVRGRWPDREAVQLPDRRQLRVDRANEEPTGDEGQEVGNPPNGR